MGSPRPVPLTLSPISAPGRTDRTGAAGTPDSFRYRYPSHETGFPPCHPTSFLHHLVILRWDGFEQKFDNSASGGKLRRIGQEIEKDLVVT